MGIMQESEWHCTGKGSYIDLDWWALAHCFSLLQPQFITFGIFWAVSRNWVLLIPHIKTSLGKKWLVWVENRDRRMAFGFLVSLWPAFLWTTLCINAACMEIVPFCYPVWRWAGWRFQDGRFFLFCWWGIHWGIYFPSWFVHLTFFRTRRHGGSFGFGGFYFLTTCKGLNDCLILTAC